MSIKISAFLALAIISNLSFGQANEFSNYIDTKDLAKHLNILASDEYEGRETGKEGQKKAANYIAKEFERLGLAAIGNDGFFQTFELTQKTLAKRTLEINQKQFEYGKDFYCGKAKSRVDFQSNEIIFAGYGIINENRNDFNGIDIKGKIVVILSGQPNGAQDANFKSATAAKNKKVEAIQKLKPEAIILIDQDYSKYANFYKHQMESSSLSLSYKNSNSSDTLSSVITISEETANELLKPNKKTVGKLEKLYNKKSKSNKIIILKSTMHASIFYLEEEVSTENVIGLISGSEIPEEYIFITAHYDHIGVIDGKVYNGADDDGSGTVSVLEIAEAFSKAKLAGKGPKRSIVFMTVSGEEKGLLGSQFYVDHPIFPLKNTICNLNIDMVGRIDKQHAKDSNYVYVIGADKLSSELSAINEEANANHTNLNLDYTYNKPTDPNRFYYRSDHYNFAKNNIPIIFYFNGTHEDYHKDTDEVNKINFPLMKTRASLVFYTAWELANRKTTIKVDRKSDFEEK